MPNFRHRLTRTQQRIYDRSNQVASIKLPFLPQLSHSLAGLPAALEAGDQVRVERTAQQLADCVTAALRIAGVRIRVNGTRPSNTRGELHGLYTRPEGGERAKIEVWMRTAKRKQVVAYKTFLRTVLHELCHHLDYELLRLADSFHTDGFYQRESSLFRQIGVPSAGAGAGLRERSRSQGAAFRRPGLGDVMRGSR
jgi:hypothetical protein